MSVKKDRVNKRKWRNAQGNFWTVPKYWKKDLNRQHRAKVKQMMRVEKYDTIPRSFQDAGYDYW